MSYQGSGIGAIETVDGDGRLDLLAASSSGGGGVGAHGSPGNCPRGSGSSERADGLSGQHDGERERVEYQARGRQLEGGMGTHGELTLGFNSSSVEVVV